MSHDQWVVLELSSKAEGEDPVNICKSITYMIRGAEVFVPAIITQVGGDRVVHYLVEGYAFIRHIHLDGVYSRLEDSKYVSHVVRKTMGVGPNGRPIRKLATITTADIDRMKSQIHAETDQGIGVGDIVLITSGAYKQLESEIITDIPEEDKVQVRVLLKSKDTIVSLPRSFLKLVKKASRPIEEPQPFDGPKPLPNPMASFFPWFDRARQFVRTLSETTNGVPVGRVLLNYGVILRLEDWIGTLGIGSRFLREVMGPSPDSSPIQMQWSKANLLHGWVERCQNLVVSVRAWAPGKMDSLPLDHGLLQLMTVESYLEQIRKIYDELEELEEEMDISQLEGTQNIIVDGLNLAYRCLYAPGISDMRSSDGKPTGVIFGFVRTLASLMKKMPGAHVYIAWDGSNQRRRSLFAPYKGNRAQASTVDTADSHQPFDQVQFIKNLLPRLGVTQAVNPEEEADDVIASLVRGKLSGQKNVILSTDRDLLQLVSSNTLLLLPAQGKRQEVVCDENYLLEQWGVSPDRIVTLRALLGDTSDNIPGIPTVPEGILKSLLQLYGDIDGIFSSSLAGLTKKRYDCIRGAESQVRLNIELMTLCTVPVGIVEPVPDASIVLQLLTELDIRAEPIVTQFFLGHQSEDGH